MKVIDLRAEQTRQWRSLLCRKYTPEEKLINQVSTILSEVRHRGDEALIEFARRFDSVEFTPPELAVSEAETKVAAGLVKATTALKASWGSTCASDWIVKKGQSCA